MLSSLAGLLASLSLWIGLFGAGHVRGSALTTTISAHERSCFYAWVDKVGEKVGFYFAVSSRKRGLHLMSLNVMFATRLQVQSGGSFDVDWVITDPTDTIVLEGDRDRQGDYIFTAQLEGEYSFCFS